MKMKIKKIIAILLTLSLLMALTACSKPPVEINWGSSSLAARVEKISGSTVTLTLGVIDKSDNTGESYQNGTTQNGDNTMGNENGGNTAPEAENGGNNSSNNPADGGNNGNTAEDSGTGEAGPGSAPNEVSPGEGEESIGQQQENAGGVSFGDGGASEDYESPDSGNLDTPDGSANENSEGNTQSASNGRFVSGGTTIKLTLNNEGLLSMMGLDGTSASAKLADLKVGDIVTIDHDSRGNINGIVLRRDIIGNM